MCKVFLAIHLNCIFNLDKHVCIWYFRHVLKLWTGLVEIVDPHYPWYVKSGATLTIVCQSVERSSIEWWQQTLVTDWKDVRLVPTSGQDITVQSCTDEPSGFSKSTLSRSNMSLNDRGMYQCKDSDESSSYAVWVTVLYSMLISFMCFCAIWKHLDLQ